VTGSWAKGWRPAVPIATLAIYGSVDLAHTWSRGHVPTRMATLLEKVALHHGLLLFLIVVATTLTGARIAADLGYSLERGRRQLLTGLALGVGSFVVISALESLLASALGEGETPYAPLLADPRNLPAWLTLGWLAGGLVEETERVFTVRAFERLLGERGARIGALVAAIFFGLGHLQQGVAAAIGSGLLGLLYGVVFLRRRRTLEIAIAHGTYDTIGILLAMFVVRG
jgi:membrane protease YdiL (CAAX protease family)